MDGMPFMISSAALMNRIPERAYFLGGLWLSSGFLKSEKLGPWEMDCSLMKFAFKNESSGKRENGTS